MVLADIFECDNKNYLVLVDFYSNFGEVDPISNLTSQAVIKAMRPHFARYGIPQTLLTDNGTQFTSREFQNFVGTWEFTHIKCSPHHHQSNGKAESTVKTAQRIMKKAKEAKTDPYLSILAWRNTPTQGLQTSPSQRLMSRRARTTLPTKFEQVKPNINILQDEKSKMEELKEKQKKTA